MNMSVTKRRNKYWIDFRFDRKRYRRPSPDNSSAGAKNYEAFLRQRLAKGESLEREIKKPESVPTFLDFSKKWFDVYVKNNNKYSEVLNKESLLRAHLVPFFGKKLLDKISNLDVESYKAKKIQAGQANKSINNQLIVLSKCLRVAQEWEVINKIPRIKLLKVQPQKFDFLSTDECQNLIDHCDGVIKEMVIFGLKTGLRFGELIAIEWSDINLSGRIATIQKSIARGRLGSTKSNKIRYIPLLDDIIQMIEVRPKKTGFIFTKGENKPLVQLSCIQQLHRSCKRAGMRNIGWHALRHTFASQLAQGGVSILVIKELLGHSDLKTTMRYSHLTASTVRGAIETLKYTPGHNLVTIDNNEEKNGLIPVYEIMEKTQ